MLAYLIIVNSRVNVFHRPSKDYKRIVYTILEYCPLLDSCNMTTDDWGKVGKDIEVCDVY